MGAEAVAIIERLFKAFVFVPCMGLIGWWIFSGWLDNTLSWNEAVIGTILLAAAFALGVISIVSGGWGFVGVLALIYIALLSLLVWEYVYWRRKEREHLFAEVERYQDAIARDPRNAAAYSYLGKTHLALRQPDEAMSALQQALGLDPESHTDRSLMVQAREMKEREGRRRAVFARRRQ
jgi:tetratricopeptide (TPR) repeat protein